jgi:Leucine-rich repeat (LRR) protein
MITFLLKTAVHVNYLTWHLPRRWAEWWWGAGQPSTIDILKGFFAYSCSSSEGRKNLFTRPAAAGSIATPISGIARTSGQDGIEIPGLPVTGLPSTLPSLEEAKATSIHASIPRVALDKEEMEKKEEEGASKKQTRKKEVGGLQVALSSMTINSSRTETNLSEQEQGNSFLNVTSSKPKTAQRFTRRLPSTTIRSRSMEIFTRIGKRAFSGMDGPMGLRFTGKAIVGCQMVFAFVCTLCYIPFAVYVFGQCVGQDKHCADLYGPSWQTAWPRVYFRSGIFGEITCGEEFVISAHISGATVRHMKGDGAAGGVASRTVGFPAAWLNFSLFTRLKNIDISESGIEHISVDACNTLGNELAASDRSGQGRTGDAPLRITAKGAPLYHRLQWHNLTSRDVSYLSTAPASCCRFISQVLETTEFSLAGNRVPNFVGGCVPNKFIRGVDRISENADFRLWVDRCNSLVGNKCTSKADWPQGSGGKCEASVGDSFCLSSLGPRLTVLNVSGNAMNETALEALADMAYTHMLRLRVLDAGYNRIDSISMNVLKVMGYTRAFVPGELSPMRLLLRGNDLTHISWSASETSAFIMNGENLPFRDELAMMPSLKIFNIDRLVAHPNILKDICHYAPHLTRLVYIRTGLDVAPRDLGGLKNLRSLSLARNHLVGIDSGLLDSATLQKNLKRLDVFNNAMTSLPLSLGRLTGLQSLDVDNMNRDGGGGDLVDAVKLESLPPNLIRLDVSYLPANKLPLGGLADRLSKLTYLRMFYTLGNTQLPPELGRLTNLEQLDVRVRARERRREQVCAYFIDDLHVHGQTGELC